MMGASEVHWCRKVRGMSPKSFFLNLKRSKKY